MTISIHPKKETGRHNHWNSSAGDTPEKDDKIMDSKIISAQERCYGMVLLPMIL